MRVGQYVLSTYQPDGPPPASVNIAEIVERLSELNREMERAGVRLLAAHLSPAQAASVVRVSEGKAIVSDGPYLEADEHAGGLSLINVADRGAALQWGEKLAAATGLPVEIRELSENRDGLA
jgi:hypothetical protein